MFAAEEFLHLVHQQWNIGSECVSIIDWLSLFAYKLNCSVCILIDHSNTHSYSGNTQSYSGNTNLTVAIHNSYSCNAHSYSYNT